MHNVGVHISKFRVLPIKVILIWHCIHTKNSPLFSSHKLQVLKTHASTLCFNVPSQARKVKRALLPTFRSGVKSQATKR